MLGKSKVVDDFSLDRNPRHYSAKLGKRLSGRLSTPVSETVPTPSTAAGGSQTQDSEIQDQRGSVLEEISLWLHEEKGRRRAKKNKRKAKASAARAAEQTNNHSLRGDIRSKTHTEQRRLSENSSDSGDSAALEKLEGIIEGGGPFRVLERIPSRKSFAGLRRPTSLKKLRQQSIVSDTEVQDDEFVPSCDVVLDNSKTLSYPEATGASSVDLLGLGMTVTKDRDAWLIFKYEIVRLAHTLRLKGWRQVPMSKSSDIDVERLSGALTNAVYVVAPPSDLSSRTVETSDNTQALAPRKPPP